MVFYGDAAKPPGGVGSHGMTDGGKHRYICSAVGESTRLGKVNSFFNSVLPDASRLLVFGQQWRKNATRGNMILEFQPIANDFIHSKVQGDRPDLKIERPGY